MEIIIMKFKCKICGYQCKTKRALTNHLTIKHKDEITKQQYSNKYNMGWYNYCKICNKLLCRGNKSGYCDKHRDRSGQNNSFYGKTHSKKTIKIIKQKCRIASTKLWQNDQYRKKVIQGVSKPRSQQGKLNISKGVKSSYDNIQGLRQLRSKRMKKTWQSGNMILSDYNVNKSKAQYQIAQILKNKFKDKKILLKQSIKYKKGKLNKWLFPDILINDNIIIQYYGDYWHMNPQLHQSNDTNEKTNTLAKECWINDQQRINILKHLGYKVYIIWQNDYKNNKDQVLNNLYQYLIINS